jgi:hypothetical protein
VEVLELVVVTVLDRSLAEELLQLLVTKAVGLLLAALQLSGITLHVHVLLTLVGLLFGVLADVDRDNRERG